MYNIFFQSVNSIIPMKEAAEKALKRLNIYNIRDLLFYKPYSYNISDTSSDIPKLKHNTLIQIEVKIEEIERPSSARSPVKILVSNETGYLTLIFFNKIPPFIFNKLKIGTKCTIAGKVQYFDGSFQISHPEFLFKKSLCVPVEPIYHLTYGLINKQLYDYILSAIKAVEVSINARIAFGSSVSQAPNIFYNQQSYIISLIHEIKRLHLVGQSPNANSVECALIETNIMLAAKELFANQVALSRLKRKEQETIGRSFMHAHDLSEQILNELGFTLTNAQHSAIKQIEIDQASDKQMMRLLQGDVGSGKTLVALITILNVAYSGAQSVLMAPTDLLSVQHFQFFKQALANTIFKVTILTGKTSIKERKIIKKQIEDGEIDIVIGTHALFQENVVFKNLGYIVIDEQHRFGVEQRMELIKKGLHPDVLVMTATPIPRSLCLTMFGDMDISIVNEKPKNRIPIITSVISLTKKEQIIHSLQKKIDLGEKIYWVCPRVDQSDKIVEINEEYTCADVHNVFTQLNKLFPDQVGIVHGKLKANDKDLIMEQFKNGDFKILVATTVIEVGIDVPDASLIIIENAERFGLAQLHQLRGRVGRGSIQSHCILIYNPKMLSAIGKQRLEIMRQSNDGFYISEQDLKLRGGGEILGTRQSGEPDFFFADLARDTELLIKANKMATIAEYSEFIEFQIRLFDKEKDNLTKSG
ncbi:MAG: ATP-dependent DNA helicase RecG [Rickettsiales bacterium]|nr:MAG: ATP-dependent DNA helicase RecG [Rickettsiales bacterium]